MSPWHICCHCVERREDTTCVEQCDINQIDYYNLSSAQPSTAHMRPLSVWFTLCMMLRGGGGGGGEVDKT